MKEFDFDELDKAVGSVLGSNNPATTEPSAAAKATEPTSSPAVPQENPLPASPQPAQQDVSASTPTPTPAAAPVEPTTPAPQPSTPSRPAPAVTPTRRSGRFMDVVHPGASTGTPKQDSGGGQATPRTTPDIQPANQNRATQDVASPVRPPVASEPVKTTAPTTDRAALDNIDTTPKPQQSVEQPTEAAPAPLSPFISDAKVEKRPLGAFSAKNNIPDKEADKPIDDPKTPDTKQQPQPEPEKLPPELDSKVVALESNDETNDDGPGLASTAAQGASLSIPQQYTPTPPEDNSAQHQVFDTEQYHPALTTATQSHKHTWLWVTLAAVILLVAAGIFGYWFFSGL